ncbi:MAG: DUF2147 domain-containing protein [Phenylobacterium zucineum]|nr:MAG: DUF2147 domain-containing protein [Phenylobacterium zucineum]
MHIVKSAIAALVGVLAISAAATPAAAQGDASLYGVWRNPKNSVHVEIKPCAQGACGYVVWATEKAKADAREGGTANLVGLQLFREFTPRANGVWKGKVFIPDLNRTFTGTAEPVDGKTLKARGCLLANVLCKSQNWTRVS